MPGDRAKKAAPRHLSEPWFSLVATGAKTFEGRLGNSALAAAPVGSTLVFFNDDLGRRRTVRVAVTGVERFASFRAMLAPAGALARALPTVATVRDGVAVYRAF